MRGKSRVLALSISNGENNGKANLVRIFCLLSILIWLIATSILRLWGHTFFIPTPLIMSVNFLWSVLFLPPLVYGIFRWQKVPPQQRQDVAIWLVVPSMLLDVLSTYFFPQVFPNMLPSVDGPFGAWMLWGYAIVLMTGVITSRFSFFKSQTL